MRKKRAAMYVLFTIILLAQQGLPACSSSAGKELDAVIDIGTHSLHIRCAGSGSPTVVIDTGHGDLTSEWHGIQDRLAQGTRVCTYDRAGYGQSEPGPMPRHSQRSADELRMLLDKAGIWGPYVLVGHSLGGLNMQVFADRYPDQVRRASSARSRAPGCHRWGGVPRSVRDGSRTGV